MSLRACQRPIIGRILTKFRTSLKNEGVGPPPSAVIGKGMSERMKRPAGAPVPHAGPTLKKKKPVLPNGVSFRQDAPPIIARGGILLVTHTAAR